MVVGVKARKKVGQGSKCLGCEIAIMNSDNFVIGCIYRREYGERIKS